MNRTNITDREDGSYRGWFDEDAALTFKEGATSDGSNRISRATGSQWEHEELYYTRSGNWVLCSWSQWQGRATTYHQISEAEAFRWLTVQELETAEGQGRYGHQPGDSDAAPDNLPAAVRARLAEVVTRAEI